LQHIIFLCFTDENHTGLKQDEQTAEVEHNSS